MVEAMEVISDVETLPILDIGNEISMTDVTKILSYLQRGVELNQVRLIQRAIRQNAKIRHYISPHVLSNIISKYFNLNLTIYNAISTSLIKLAIHDKVITTITPSISMDIEQEHNNNVLLPEIEVYLWTLLVTTLLRFNENETAAYCATSLIERIRIFNRRSLDILSSKALFYFSLAYERINRLENIRSILLGTNCLYNLYVISNLYHI
jgi:26S proteasome regulatory subunit N3